MVKTRRGEGKIRQPRIYYQNNKAFVHKPLIRALSYRLIGSVCTMIVGCYPHHRTYVSNI